MVWFGRDLKARPVPSLAMDRDTFQVSPSNRFSSITVPSVLSLRDSEQRKHQAKGWLVPRMLVVKNQKAGKKPKNSYS